MPEVRYVRSIERAIDALELLVRAERPLTLAEIVGQLGAPKSTVLNILRTLVRRRLVEHDEGSRSYRPGYRLAALAERAGTAAGLPRTARAHLEALARASGEVALLAVPDGDGIIFIDKVESPQPIQYVPPVGTRRPLHCNSAGKMTLAMRPPQEWDAYVARVGLARYTASTIVDAQKLKAELRRIRRNGYAVSDGELLEDLIGLAAPVLQGPGGAFLAVVVVAGPAFRMRRRLPDLLATLRREATALSEELAGLPLPAARQ